MFTLLVAAFLIVPAVLSMIAGVTVNYFQGVSSGLTLNWIGEVWEPVRRNHLPLVPDRLCGTLSSHWSSEFRRRTAACARRPLARLVEEIITLPLAIPGLAIALALLLTYRGSAIFDAPGVHSGRPYRFHAAVHGALRDGRICGD